MAHERKIVTAHEWAQSAPEYLVTHCESSYVEFKSEFDPTSSHDWCEIVKDIVAIANSGGGLIFIGLDDGGNPLLCDVSRILDIDPAEACKKIEKYTEGGFSDFRIFPVLVEQKQVACFAIGAASIPLVFTKPGTYAVPGPTQQKTAFGQGTLYFRHGAKSEHAHPDDLRCFLEREVERVRHVWLENVRRIAEAPAHARVAIVNDDDAPSIGTKLVRLSTNQDAPEVRELNPNDTHPYRQKEALQQFKNRGIPITPYDLLAVRRHHAVEANVEFCHKPTFSSVQYSAAFMEWVTENYTKDPRFFKIAKNGFKATISHYSDPNDERLVWLKNHMSENGLSISGMAKRLKISDATLSRLQSGKYKGDVENMLAKISKYRENPVLPSTH